MKETKPFCFSDRIKSVGFAFQGITTFFKTQHNAWIHAFAAIVTISLGFVLKLSLNEWCWIVVAIALVFISEMLNTAIEFLTNLVSPEFHPLAKKVKDVAAAAVLIAAFTAIVIGITIFLPKII
jgi:diacylglycerol kinase (ATP)